MSNLIYVLDREEIIKAILLYLETEKGFKSTDNLCEFYYSDDSLDECRVNVETVEK